MHCCARNLRTPPTLDLSVSHVRPLGPLQGSEGEEVAMPPCARALAPHGDDADGEPAVLVRWHVASPAGAGHFLLLARLAHQLGALRQARLPGLICARVCGVPASPAGEGHREEPSLVRGD